MLLLLLLLVGNGAGVEGNGNDVEEVIQLSDDGTGACLDCIKSACLSVHQEGAYAGIFTHR